MSLNDSPHGCGDHSDENMLEHINDKLGFIVLLLWGYGLFKLVSWLLWRQ
jgi:hypothetical protein